MKMLSKRDIFMRDMEKEGRVDKNQRILVGYYPSNHPIPEKFKEKEKEIIESHLPVRLVEEKFNTVCFKHGSLLFKGKPALFKPYILHLWGADLNTIFELIMETQKLRREFAKVAGEEAFPYSKEGTLTLKLDEDTELPYHDRVIVVNLESILPDFLHSIKKLEEEKGKGNWEYLKKTTTVGKIINRLRWIDLTENVFTILLSPNLSSNSIDEIETALYNENIESILGPFRVVVPAEKMEKNIVEKIILEIYYGKEKPKNIFVIGTEEIKAYTEGISLPIELKLTSTPEETLRTIEEVIIKNNEEK